MSISGARVRVAGAARAARSALRAVGRATRRATSASGAGGSGLSNLIELHAVNQAGDTLVALALAGTLFFGVPVDQARGRVALYLLITMAPFAVVAPLVGPALDRMRSGRRYALAGTMLARGLLCWGMAGAVLSQDAVTLYPAAFGVLVLAKGYGVARSAVIPRVLPHEISLVTANARLSLAGTVGAAVAGGVGAGLTALVGPGWVLRVTVLVFIAGTVLAVRLPANVDSVEQEQGDSVEQEQGDPAGQEQGDAAGDRQGDSAGGGRSGAARGESLRPRYARLGPRVMEALRANAALRAFSGFLILYLAFLLRAKGFPDVPQPVALGMLAVAAGAGGLAGTGIGALARSRAPGTIVLTTLVVVTAAVGTAAWFYGLVAAVGVALAAGLGQTLGKFGLDALIQQDVREEVRSSAFGRSETLLQLSWVVGGGLGLALSLEPNGTLGLGIAAGGLSVVLAALVVARVRGSRRRRELRVSPPEQPSAAPHRP